MGDIALVRGAFATFVDDPDTVRVESAPSSPPRDDRPFSRSYSEHAPESCCHVSVAGEARLRGDVCKAHIWSMAACVSDQGSGMRNPPIHERSVQCRTSRGFEGAGEISLGEIDLPG